MTGNPQILPVTAPILVSVVNQTSFSIALPPPINQVVPKGGKVTVPIDNEMDLNQPDIARAVDKGWIVLLLNEFQHGGMKSLVLDPVRRGELSYCDHFFNLSVDGTIIHQRTGLVPPASVLAASFSGQQVDQPRTVRVVVAGTAVGLVNVRGLLAIGEQNVESINVTAPGTYESVASYALVQVIDFPLIPAASSITVAMSSKLGLSGLISSSNSVFKVVKNGRDFPFDANLAVNSDDGTFDTGGIVAADSFTLRYKP